MAMTEKGKHNKRLGARGERRARSYLRKNGYKIVAKNYKNPFGEVDIIAAKGEVLAFVEVKTRESGEYAAPSENVNAVRRRRYIRAAQFFTKDRDDVIVRFDVIEVVRKEINHIENAWY